MHGERLVRPPGVHVGGAQVLQAQRVLRVDHMQVGELHERGERGAAAVPAGAGAGQLAAYHPFPSGPFVEAPVAGGTAAARYGHPGHGGAACVRGERGGRRLPGGGEDGLVRAGIGGDGLAAAGAQGVSGAGGEGDRAGDGEEGAAVECGGVGDWAYARHGACPPGCERIGSDRGAFAGRTSRSYWMLGSGNGLRVNATATRDTDRRTWILDHPARRHPLPHRPGTGHTAFT
ncbi:hypothetical protein SHIRM173S_12989 [Streptomyces hirsutus]